MHRKLIAFVSLAALSMLGSCTTRYQDLLHDRDGQIRELNGKVAQLRAEKEEADRKEAQARADLEKSKTEAPARDSGTNPADAGAAGNLQKDLPDGATAGYSRGRLSITIENSVTFDSGSVALKDGSHRILKQVANVLKSKYPGRRYYIEGHTDTDPIVQTKDKFSNNRDLSVKRAEAVATYLIEQGIAERNIVVAGYGQYDPKDARNKSKNRRVEIVVGESL